MCSVATMAGGAADCQFWVRVLAQHCALHELQEKERISVAAASKVLANALGNYRGMGLSVYTMVAGYDNTGLSVSPYLTDEQVMMVICCRPANLPHDQRGHARARPPLLRRLGLDVRARRARRHVQAQGWGLLRVSKEKNERTKC